MKRLLAILVCGLVAGAWAQTPSKPTAAPGAGVQSPDLASLVRKIDEAALANRQHYRAFVVTREYQMYGSNEQKPASEVVARVNFVPPDTKDFQILEATGSSRGEGIVRHMLEDERKAAETGSARGAVTSVNYTFAYLREEQLDGHDCYLLRITPKVKDRSLIDGQAWVDKSTYLVRKVDGEMSKLPSWWLKSVHVTLDFNGFDGMWLHTGTRAVADVRIFGRHTFVGHDVRYEATDAVASTAVRGRTHRRSSSAEVIGAAIHER